MQYNSARLDHKQQIASTRNAVVKVPNSNDRNIWSLNSVIVIFFGTKIPSVLTATI